MLRPLTVIPAKAGIRQLFSRLGPRFRGDGDRALRRLATLSLLAWAALTVAGCGFHMRGQAQLPFETIYIPGNSALVVDLKRNVAAASKTRLVDDAKDAEAILGFTQDLREKVILSFNTSGRVQEYRLRYRVGFRVTDPKGQVFVPTSEIILTRDITYSDSLVLSKETEEGQLYRDMQGDMVQQILRRLVAARPATSGID
jgi:LPS-assembly lipoprotein